MTYRGQNILGSVVSEGRVYYIVLHALCLSHILHAGSSDCHFLCIGVQDMADKYTAKIFKYSFFSNFLEFFLAKFCRYT